jgi:ATP-dependent helicase Lhr and Lhr-like helicase
MRAGFVWAGEGRVQKESGLLALTAARLIPRGNEDLWHAPEPALQSALDDAAKRVLQILRDRGAQFFADLQRHSALGSHALRDALRQLVAAGIVTADSVDALAAVSQLRPLANWRRAEPDPTRWLPAGFERQSPIVQRRPNVTRLPRWRRPDLPGRGDGWAGRWATLPEPDEPPVPRAEEETEAARAILQTWLERYGVVSRDVHRFERPALPWRAMYEAAREMELRGALRRGYFVRGLSGAQFALADAVERLREIAADADAPAVTMTARDPANAFRWARGVRLLPDAEKDPAPPTLRARTLVVTRAGRVVLTAEGRFERLRTAAEASQRDLEAAAKALTEHVQRRAGDSAGLRRETRIRQIDDVSAMRHPLAAHFIAAGWRDVAMDLIFDPRRPRTVPPS